MCQYVCVCVCCRLLGDCDQLKANEGCVRVPPVHSPQLPSSGGVEGLSSEGKQREPVSSGKNQFSSITDISTICKRT